MYSTVVTVNPGLRDFCEVRNVNPVIAENQLARGILSKSNLGLGSETPVVGVGGQALHENEGFKEAEAP